MNVDCPSGRKRDLVLRHALAIAYRRGVGLCSALNDASRRAANGFGIAYERMWRGYGIVEPAPTPYWPNTPLR